MTRFMTKLLAFAALALLAIGNVAHAQQASPVAGDYAATLGPLSLRLHINVAADGTLAGTLDSPNQGALGIPCSDFRIEGTTLSFKVPSVNGTWQGSIEASGARLTGTWSQGTPQSLVFSRDSFVPAAKPSAVDGIWLGTEKKDGRSLRIQLVVESDANGGLRCSGDSIDEFAYGIDCTNAKYSAERFSFEIPLVKGRWTGTLSKDGNTLTGTWTQEKSERGPATPPTALTFTRQTQRLSMANAFPVTYDEAIDPVSAANLESVMRRDLDQPLKSGILAPSSPIGMVVGVVRDGERRVFAFGKATPDALFEIGSITKTFTGLLLALAIEQGQVKADTPVRELLPPDTVTKPAGSEITLLDLVTQHSGLPRMPSNFQPKDRFNPYADYDTARLYEFLRGHGVAKPVQAEYLYSNLGLGLLGQALANRANTDYAALLKRSILDPLGMRETSITLDTAQQRRFIQGHDPARRPAHAWDLTAFAGAGGLRSTAADMLKYVEANLRQQAAGDTATTPDGRALAAALVRSQTLQSDGPGTRRIAYAWLYDPATETYSHGGATGGYNAFAFFSSKRNHAGVVLTNLAPSPRGGFADAIASHVAARLAGEKPISLKDW